jgi:predicted PurR-regulated permease PerM
MIRKAVLFQAFFTVAFVGLIYETSVLMEPLLTPLLLAIIIWLLALPMDLYFARRWPKRSATSRAFISTMAVLLIVFVPLVLLLWLFINEFQNLIPRLQANFDMAKAWLQNPPIQDWAYFHRLEVLHRHIPWVPQPDIKNRLMTFGAEFLASMTQAGGALAANMAVFLFYIGIILLTLFFLFSEGRQWYEKFMELIPMRTEQKKKIVHTFRESVTNIARGSIITSVFQTLTAIIGYWIVGMDASITLGLATGVASFVPVVGSAVVWLPVAIFWWMKGVYWKCIFLVLWGTFLIALTDNVIRTYFIGKSDETPLFFMFLGLIGGIAVYGAPGLLIGPLVVAVLPVFISIYKEMYLNNE